MDGLDGKGSPLQLYEEEASSPMDDIQPYINDVVEDVHKEVRFDTNGGPLSRNKTFIPLKKSTSILKRNRRAP